MSALLRRSAPLKEPLLTLGPVTIDLGKRVTRTRSGDEKKLTPLEYRILESLIRHADVIVPHTALMQEAWGPHQTDIRGLRAYITSLRRKLEPDPARPRCILTEPGAGYRLARPQNPAAL